MANKFLSLNASGKKTLTAPAAGDIASGTLAASLMPAFKGDATSSAGAVTLSLATVNSNVGTFGSSSAIPVVTVNAKGLVTAVSTVAASGGSGGGAGSVVLDVSWDTSSAGTQQNVSNAFTTLDYHSKAPTTDTASGWSAANNAYTVPTAGTYMIVSKLRLADGTPNISHSQGVDVNNADAAWVAWATFPTNSQNVSRFTLINTRIAHFAAGAVLHHFAFCEGQLGTVNAISLNIVLLAAG